MRPTASACQKVFARLGLFMPSFAKRAILPVLSPAGEQSGALCAPRRESGGSPPPLFHTIPPVLSFMKSTSLTVWAVTLLRYYYFGVNSPEMGIFHIRKSLPGSFRASPPALRPVRRHPWPFLANWRRPAAKPALGAAQFRARPSARCSVFCPAPPL